ncbi:MAG: SMC-Scp complex subunit ScpB [Alphaproteobacteria bacterium]|nr:MAG: SMC-Scp complex subunit ScpB [Alphaproteobacteria bacterium]
MTDRFLQLRLIEALLFASAEPLGPDQIARHLPEGTDLDELMAELGGLYANRGVNLVRVGKRWAFRTAPDIAPLMQIETTVTRKLSRAAVETLAIIAYHQPVTRAEIEEIRGVALSRGTLDTLLEAGWIKPRGRRRTPGRPVTWGTTEAFLDHFGLESLDSLPGMAELKAAGLIDTRPAITALGARGHLLQPGEAGEDTDPGDNDNDTEAGTADGEPTPEEALAADFGDDLVPEGSGASDENGAPEQGADNDRRAEAGDSVPPVVADIEDGENIAR